MSGRCSRQTIRNWSTGQGWILERDLSPTMLYVARTPVVSQFTRFDVLTHETSPVFDVSTATELFGSPRIIWQLHSSNDDQVHSFTVRVDGGNYDMLGCGVYLEASQQSKYFPRISSKPA